MCCRHSDVYESPLSAAETRAESIRADIEAAKEGVLPRYWWVHTGFASKRFEDLWHRHDAYALTIAMLRAATQFWPEASYATACYSTHTFTNQPRDVEQLVEAVRAADASWLAGEAGRSEMRAKETASIIAALASVPSGRRCGCGNTSAAQCSMGACRACCRDSRCPRHR